VYIEDSLGQVEQLTFTFNKENDKEEQKGISDFRQLVEKHLISNFVRCFFIGIFAEKIR
jgi:hypothetical protein